MKYNKKLLSILINLFVLLCMSWLICAAQQPREESVKAAEKAKGETRKPLYLSEDQAYKVREIIIDIYKDARKRTLSTNQQENVDWNKDLSKSANDTLTLKYLPPKEKTSKELSALDEKPSAKEKLKKRGANYLKNIATWLKDGFYFDSELYDITGKKGALKLKSRTPDLGDPTIKISDMEDSKFNPRKEGLGKIEKLYYMILQMTKENTDAEHVTKHLKQVRSIDSKIKTHTKSKATKLLKGITETIKPPELKKIAEKYMALLYKIDKKVKDLDSDNKTKKEIDKFNEKIKEYGIDTSQPQSEAIKNAIFMPVELYAVDEVDEKLPDQELLKKINLLREIVFKVDFFKEKLGPSAVLSYLKAIKKIESEIKSHTKFKVTRLKRINPPELRTVTRAYLSLLHILFPRYDKFDLRKSKKTVAKIQGNAALYGVKSDPGINDKEAIDEALYLPLELYDVEEEKTLQKKLQILTNIINNIKDDYLNKNKNTLRKAITGLASKTLGVASKTLKELRTNTTVQRQYIDLIEKAKKNPIYAKTKGSKIKTDQIKKFDQAILKIFDEEIGDYKDAHRKILFARYMLQEIAKIKDKLVNKLNDQAWKEKNPNDTKKYEAWLKDSNKNKMDKYKIEEDEAQKKKPQIRNSLKTKNAPTAVFEKLDLRDKETGYAGRKTKAALLLKTIKPYIFTP